MTDEKAKFLNTLIDFMNLYSVNKHGKAGQRPNGPWSGVACCGLPLTTWDRRRYLLKSIFIDRVLVVRKKNFLLPGQPFGYILHQVPNI